MTKQSGLGAIAEFMNAEAAEELWSFFGGLRCPHQVDDYCFESCGYSCNMHSGLSYVAVLKVLAAVLSTEVTLISET